PVQMRGRDNGLHYWHRILTKTAQPEMAEPWFMHLHPKKLPIQIKQSTFTPMAQSYAHSVPQERRLPKTEISFTISNIQESPEVHLTSIVYLKAQNSLTHVKRSIPNPY